MKGVILIGWFWLVDEGAGSDGICLLVFRVRRDGRTGGWDGMGYGISVVTSVIDPERGMIDAYLRLGTRVN